jgi:hypothetical protein
MRVVPNGNSEYHNGNEVLRYGRDIAENSLHAVWYHDGLRCIDEPAWAMDPDVEWKVSVSADTILVADANNGLYAIDTGEFTEHTVTLDGREQYVARASDDHVTYLGDPNDHLQGHLWIESGNQVDEGYHKQANEA